MNVLKQIGQFILSTGIVMGVGSLGAVFTNMGIPEWYGTLAKPPLLPPNEVFGPVWSFLYFLIGVALFLVWTAKKKDGPGLVYVAFFTQLLLNTAWCAAFFALQLPWLGVAVIAVLVGTIVWAMREIAPFSKGAKWLFVPYLAWVLFATYLTVGVAVLN